MAAFYRKAGFLMNDPQALAPTPTTVPSIPALDIVTEQRSVREESVAATPRARKKGVTLYDRIMESVAHITTLVGASALWWIGAQFTLAFMALLHIPVGSLSYAQWLIPIGITAIEMRYWPRKGMNRNLIIVFLVIAGIDLATSLIGGKQWLTGRDIGSYIIPDTGVLWGVSLIVACFSAFWPEKLARAAITELRKIWNI